MAHIEMAEDIAAETFLAALETWPYKGVPAHPEAWLYTVAKNKAKNQLARGKLFTEKISGELIRSADTTEEMDMDISEQNIHDSQLQMMFAVCHPLLSVESQIGLALRVLCGFGIDEIAHALLSNKETISKRLARAKEKLREENISMALPSETEIPKRLSTVLTALYLLFNEGYYSETSDNPLREDLCDEAMRLTQLILDYSLTDTPETHALYALMCFHSSRFSARQDTKGEMILYAEQNESLWNRELISKGAYHLHKASVGNMYSRYHLEAGIAYWHTIKQDSHEKWENILQLFNHLLQLQYSPVAALNRTYALSKAYSKEVAIREAEKLQLTDNPYYYVLLGELYTGIDDQKAMMHLERAADMVGPGTGKQTILKKLNKIPFG